MLNEGKVNQHSGCCCNLKAEGKPDYTKPFTLACWIVVNTSPHHQNLMAGKLVGRNRKRPKGGVFT
jgi:urea transporter